MVPALAALAVGPGLLLIHLVWFRDRWREPIGNMLVYVGLGAAILFPVAFLEAALREPVLAGLVEGVEAVPTLVWTFLVIALLEESGKYFVLRLRAARDRHVDEPYDWIVYAVAVSLGFATLENLFYVFEGGLSVGVIRAVSAVPSHALDGTIMGWRLARASQLRGPAALRQRMLALVEPTLWHGAYDWLLMVAAEARDSTGTGLLVIWFALLGTQWIVSVRRLRKLCREQHVPAPPIAMPVEIAERLIHPR
jgi:RsiW-degrading membrane proteinase PrsW (M82 family)